MFAVCSHIKLYMDATGFAPVRISPATLEVATLTARSNILRDETPLCFLYFFNKMDTAGIEPARITASDLKTDSLTTRTSVLSSSLFLCFFDEVFILLGFFPERKWVLFRKKHVLTRVLSDLLIYCYINIIMNIFNKFESIKSYDLEWLLYLVYCTFMNKVHES